MLVVAVLVMLGSTAAVGRAHADVIGMFTGSWQMQSNVGDIAARTDQSIDRLQSPGVDPILFVGFGPGAQPLDLARYSRRH
jgi:hypothetical protein